MTISIVTPCYNESMGLPAFLLGLESVLINEHQHSFNIIVVDDCSTDESIKTLEAFQFEAVNITMHIIRNRFNAGHQRSIFHGLLFTKEIKQDYVIIMDSDGEDDPKAIPLLLKNKEYDIVEVRRGKRKDSLAFKIMYLFYKLLFRVLIGKQLNYGNFCMLKDSIVEKIRVTSFVHLPAYLLKQPASRTFITCDRNHRLNGKSKMGYKGLLIHGFKSLVEFGSILLFWLLRIFFIVAVFMIAITLNLFYQKFVSHTAIPGWFSTLFIGLLNLGMLCLGFFVIGILLVNRASANINNEDSLYQIIKHHGENKVV